MNLSQAKAQLRRMATETNGMLSIREVIDVLNQLPDEQQERS